VRALLPEAWTTVVDAAVLPEPRWLVSSFFFFFLF
jgi:hypothetical protein